jgi:hypothetical protein
MIVRHKDLEEIKNYEMIQGAQIQNWFILN